MDIYDAKLDHFNLEIATIDDSIEKAIIEHDIPFADGAVLQDMGQKARKVDIRCFFYNETYDTHFDFIDHLDKKELFELLHPKYGLMIGAVKSIAIKHDDRTETAEIDLSFVENIKTNTEPVTGEHVEGELESLYADSVDQQIAEFNEDIKAELGVEANSILEKELDPTKTILEQFSGVSFKARAVVKKISSFESALKSDLNNIANPANSIISTIEFTADIPGRILNAVANTAERYSLLYSGLKSSPSRFIQSYDDGITSIANALGYSKHLKLAGARQMSLDVATIFETDQVKRRTAKKLEGAKSFNSLGEYIKSKKAPPLFTQKEIEVSLYKVRSFLQSLINEARAMQSLKDMSLALERNAYRIKIEAGNIITITIDRPTPLHIVCMEHGLTYNSAERVRALNNIANPSAVSGQIQIYKGPNG